MEETFLNKQIVRAHKIRLRPTPEQVKHLTRACAAARHAYNWGKEILDYEYDMSRILYRAYGIKMQLTHARQLKKIYNQIKPDWVKDNNGTATQEAFDDLQRSVQRYWDIKTGRITVLTTGKPRRDGRDTGWLNWRTRHKHNGFRITNVSLKVDGKYVRYSKVVGLIRMCEELRFHGKLMNGTFSFDGRYWWVSIQVRVDIPVQDPPDGEVGIDLGLKYLATTSDGEIIDNPKAFYRFKQKRTRLQRKLDRQRRANNPKNYDEQGRALSGCKWVKSARMIQTEKELKIVTDNIKNIRRNAQHQFSALIAKTNGFVAVEDLNVRGMVKNRKLAKAISDAGFFEIRRQLTYKVEETGGHVEAISQWFPSSKMCHGCGWINAGLRLSDREWTCGGCGNVNHRDGNAAVNILQEAKRQVTE